jgi:hypothetical protein
MIVVSTPWMIAPSTRTDFTTRANVTGSDQIGEGTLLVRGAGVGTIKECLHRADTTARCHAQYKALHTSAHGSQAALRFGQRPSE